MTKTWRNKQRNSYFDFLRGLAILMVVGIHTYPNGHHLNGSLSEIIQLVLINAFNCAVPLFLAISGFFIAKKKLDTMPECLSFWKKQIPTVYLPCIIFSIPWFIISCISIDFKWRGVFNNLIFLFSCGYSVYYFIALIIECYLLTPLLVRYNNGKTLIFVIVVSFLSISILDYVQFYHSIHLPLIVRGAFPPLLIFYYLGIYLSNHTRKYTLTIPIIMIVAGLILGLLHMQYIRMNFGESAQGQKLSLYLFDIGVIILLMSKKIEKLYKANSFNKIILYLGEISFGIYFTHVYLISLLDKYIPSLRLNWLLLWIFSLCFTIMGIAIIKKIAPTFSRKYLGYR